MHHRRLNEFAHALGVALDARRSVFGSHWRIHLELGFALLALEMIGRHAPSLT